MKLLQTFLLAFLICAPGWAQDNEEVQEIKYVTDQLRLSLYKKPNDKSGTLRLLTSGDELEILQLSGSYSKVRLSNGTVGWAKTGFLVSEPTASYQLREEQEKTARLEEKIEKLANTQQLIDDYENTIALMKQDQARLTEERDQYQAEMRDLSVAQQELREQIEQIEQGTNPIDSLDELARMYWYVPLAAAVLIWLLGLLMGRALVERRVRKRFQGVKVL